LLAAAPNLAPGHTQSFSFVTSGIGPGEPFNVQFSLKILF